MAIVSNRIVLCAAAFLVLCHCGPSRQRSVDDVGAFDAIGADAQCHTTCTGNAALVCNDDGTTTLNTCGSSVCITGLGCVMCAPGLNRCSPDDPDQIEQCTADGTDWMPSQLCDASNAMTCLAGDCVQRCVTPPGSYLSCDYVATVTPNTGLGGMSATSHTFPFAVVIANPHRYAVDVTVSGGALAAPIINTIEPGGVQSITLPWVPSLWQLVVGSMTHDPTSVLAAASAYHIVSNGPIAAYQFNSLFYRAPADLVYSYSNDASLLLPTSVLTPHYIVSTRDSGVDGGFFAVVGVQDGTQVTTDLTSPVWSPDGSTVLTGTQTFTVNTGDVLLLVGAPQAGGHSGDLTGTVINASQPVAVFAGTNCSNVPGDVQYCDHLEEQMLPLEAWGHHYAVSRFNDRGPSVQTIVRVLAQHDGTTLTFDGIPAPAECSAPLAAGAFCEFASSGNFQINASAAILVTQFMRGEDRSRCTSAMILTDPACSGDPSSVTEIPIEQYRSSYDFLVPSTYVYNWINVVAPTGTYLYLDEMLLSDTPQPAGTGYEVHFVPVMAGPHHIVAGCAPDETCDPNLPFGIIVYSTAPYTSFAYPGGLDATAINNPG